MITPTDNTAMSSEIIDPLLFTPRERVARGELAKRETERSEMLQAERAVEAPVALPYASRGIKGTTAANLKHNGPASGLSARC